MIKSTKMNNLENDNIKNIKKEEVCRTCLTDDGHFFNITDTFDTSTLAQMFQNITNLQMSPLDGYTQSICFHCVKEVRRANKFRMKCLESNDLLIKLETKTLEFPVSICRIDLPKLEEIKQEVEENSDATKYCLETNYDCKSESSDAESDCDNDEDLCIESKGNNTKNVNKNSPTIIFDCALCHGLFSSNNIYQKHKKDLHPDNLKDECFNQKRDPLGYILKEKHSNKVKQLYKCALDNFLGNSFVEFKNHMKEHTGEKSVICAECGFRTSEIHLLKKHRIQKHVEEKKFSCSLCNYTCQTTNALKSHLGTHSEEKNYKCQLCSLSFKYPSALSVHKKVTHQKRKPHVCPVCQKAFFHSTALRCHMAVHTGERPHICHYCGMAFSKAENMRTHAALQHEPIKTMFKCDRCSYTTKQKSQLKLHIQRHIGIKSYKCPQCPFSTVLSYNLKLHIMRHTGQKKFICDLCDYRGMSAGEVQIHRRIHTGEKPYSCTLCNYRGRTRESLKRHLQTHNPEQKFTCPNCPYKTNVEDTLRRHLRKSCIVKKRGRPSSKLPSISDSINNEEDCEEPTITLSSNILSQEK